LHMALPKIVPSWVKNEDNTFSEKLYDCSKL
jgi:hypothetical protein